MNRKIRTLILFLMLALFTGSQVYAQDQDGSLPAPKEGRILAESSFQEKPLTAEAREEVKNSEGGQGKEEANLPPDQAKEAKEEESVAQTGEKSGQEDLQKENPDQKSPAQAPEEALESPAKPTQASPAQTGETTGQDETKPSGEPKEGQEGTGKKPEDKKEKPQVDPKGDKDLSDLQGKIQAEKDPKKKAELQKEYNEKLFKAIEETGADKLNKEVLDRFTDKKRTKEFYQIQAEYEELKKKAKEGKLSQKDVEDFNKKVGSFTPPRKLDADEKSALDKLQETPYVPEVHDKEGTEGRMLFDAYKEAKEALEAALNPENPRTTDDKGLQELVDAFKKAETALIKAIKDPDGKVNPKYTKGSPEISIFPLDNNGKAGRELEEETYYVPDATDFKLLFQVNKDKEETGSTKTFKFTIKKLENVNEGDVSVPDPSLKDLVFLNGKAVELKKDKDGNYYFETTADQNFGIAQLKFNMPGFTAAFHKGFELTLEGTDAKTVKKKFLITKKGYENETDLNGIGSHEKDKPQEDVDAGKTQDGIVDGNTDKVFDFFTVLKKSDAYIDKVIVNSPNGDSLPLSSVDITITAPKNFDGNFADFIHKSGLEYHDLGDGKYQLKLDLQKFNKDEKFKVGEDGSLTYEGKAIDKETLTNVILESKDGKKYIDGNEVEHDVTTTTVLEGKLGTGADAETYQVRLSNDKHQAQSLWKKNADSSYTKVGDFKDGKVITKYKTYALRGNELISYTKETDVYEGNVSNKTEDGKTEADPTVTPTFEGKQVTVETEETNSDGTTTTKTSYGGTIIKNGIFKLIKDSEGKVIDKKYVSTNPTEWGDKIPQGYEKESGLVLIDKFGRLMKDITVNEEGGQYTFTHAKKKGEDGKVTTETRKDGRTIHVDTRETSIFVNNKNYVEKNEPKKFDSIIGKYYYDKEKKVFVLAKDGEGQKVIGDKFYEGLIKSELKKKVVETYDDGKQIVPENTQRYYGSTDKNDYYTHNNRVYVKKVDGEDTYLMSADGGKADVIAPFDIQKVIQTLGNGQNPTKVITDEKNIFDAVQNAKFAFRFPGFLAGENVIYNVHADVKATYMQPKLGKEGEFEEKSIFNNGDVNETKTVDKYFTIKIKENKKAKFFKDAPKEFKDIPDYNFFNIFYRDAEYSEARDNYVIELLKNEAKGDYSDNKIKEEQDETKKKKLENERDLLNILKSELKKIKPNAKFKFEDGKLLAVYTDESGKEVKLDRTLLWEIGFNNEDGVLFPEDRDTSIVVEDYNMDNRLVYDEIIINDTVEKWNEAKNNAKTANKEFEGTDEYFFLDQLANIRFGVSKGYVNGDFIAVGPGFKISKEEILDALKNTDAKQEVKDKNDTSKVLVTYIYNQENNKRYIEKNGIQYEVTRDTDKGQIRIKVIHAFYKNNDSYNSNDKNSNKFSSPVQEAYKKQLEDFEKYAKDFKVVKGKDAQATKDAFKTSFKDFIKKTYDDTTDCYGTLTHMFNELLENVKTEGQTVDQVKQELDKIKNKMSEEMGKMALAYLDPSKGDYKFDDMRFNAIRVELKPNITIGGAMTPQKTKKFGITSVIVPDVEIPYTDEFGKPLTNKDMYLNKFIKEVLAEKKYTEDDLGNEAKFVEVMTAAYTKLNEAIENGITIKDLVKFEDGKYSAIIGKDEEKLGPNDLAIDGKPLESKKGGTINPWYILSEDGSIKSLLEIAGNADAETKQAIEEKYGSKAIDLIAYYMHEQGYNRAFFKNFAQYKLPKKEQGPGIFGEENNWKHKLCHPGPIGQCIESAGGNNKPAESGDKDKDEAGFKSDAKITIDYPSTDDTPKEEHPKVDKTSDKKDSVDISEQDDNGKEKDQKIKFTIDVRVNQMTKKDKDLYDIKQGKTPSTKPEDYENGHYKYQDGTLIMDILPNIFKLDKDTKLDLTVEADALKKGGVNAEIFEDDNSINAWKKGIEYKYVEDLEAYLKTLSGDRQKVLQKAYDEALKAGRIKKGEKVQAVLAWLPEFVAPSGSENHFKFELKNVLVDKKEFKDYLDNGHGETYTNHAAFGDKGQVYFASTDVTIKKDKSGTVDKFLRIYDKDGKPVNEGNAKEWFEGNVELKFGDKFDYKLRYNNHIPTQETGRTGVMVSEFNIADQFTGAKGLRPVLNGFVQVQEGYEGKYNIKYYIDGKDYTKEEIEQQGLKLKDVTKISIETKTDRLGSGDHRDFILPMMIPNLDAKIENGKVFYIGTDGEKHELGDAKDFFNLDSLTNKDAKMYFENRAEDSNTVTVYLEKERFIKVFKEFLDGHGQKLKNLDNLEAKFDVYQIIKENGVKKRVKVGELVANKANDFTDMLDHLPIFKKTTTIDEKGNVTVTEVEYDYELQEVPMAGFEGKVWQLKDDKGLGFVWKAENTEKPERPPHNPPEEPKTPPETPPEEPGKPPETPGEKPKYPQDIPGDTPGKPRKPRTPNNLPKTGLVEDLGLVYLSGLALAGLVLLRKKYFLD